MLALRRCIHSGVMRDERRFVFTNHPTKPTRPAARYGPYAGARGAGRFAAVVCGPPGLAGALSAVRDGGRRRGRGVFPVRREVTLA